jgi:hypothetical protein
MTRLFFRAAFATFSTFAVVACARSSDSTGPSGPPNIIGTYSLISVNGGSLPAIQSLAGVDTVQTQFATLTLKEDSTYSDSEVVRQAYGGFVSTQPIVSTGLYAQLNDSLTLTNRSIGVVGRGTVNGKTARIVSYKGDILVYGRN